MDSARRGLDRLLAEFPEDRLVTASDLSHAEDTASSTAPLNAANSPWTLVELQAQGEKARVYAIFNYTGAVHAFDPDNPGAVHEDPLLTVDDEMPAGFDSTGVQFTTLELRAMARALGLLSSAFAKDPDEPTGVMESAQMKLETVLAMAQEEE